MDRVMNLYQQLRKPKKPVFFRTKWIKTCAETGKTIDKDKLVLFKDKKYYCEESNLYKETLNNALKENGL